MTKQPVASKGVVITHIKKTVFSFLSFQISDIKIKRSLLINKISIEERSYWNTSNKSAHRQHVCMFGCHFHCNLNFIKYMRTQEIIHQLLHTV